MTAFAYVCPNARWAVPFAEADGNRTRLGALAPTPVLKTGGPTRRPDASASEDTRGWEARSRPYSHPRVAVRAYLRGVEPSRGQVRGGRRRGGGAPRSCPAHRGP